VERPFRTAAQYYERYRLAYPPELIAQLAAAAGLDEDARVLDLGCGPGTLAIPLAEHAGEVVAVDVEPEMLERLRRAAPANVTVVEARAEDVDESFGEFRLATAGRSFHWFDTPRVLANLARLTPAVALCAEDIHEGGAQSLVMSIAHELIETPRPELPSFRYQEILAASPFSNVEVLSVEIERTWTPDELIGYALSTSRASPDRLGDRQEEFERRVRERAEPSYRERVTVDAVLGRRETLASS
jgi:ubiquinone/menaquinone biosynthesis C-methylase UbiE